MRKQSIPKKGEGLRITAKGKRKGVNGRTGHLIAAIAYGNVVIMCEPFLGKYNADSYSKFVRKYYPATFVKANNTDGKLRLHDGDLVQNCKEIHKAYSKIGCRVVPITARSTGINPVENVFNPLNASFGLI